MCTMAAELELALGGFIQEPSSTRKRGRTWSTQRSESGGEEEQTLQLMMGSMDRPPTPALLLQDLQLQFRSTTRPRNCTMPEVLPSIGKGQPSAGGLFMMNMIQSEEEVCSVSTRALELDSQSKVPLPAGWEKCLDLQTGSIYYLNRSTGLRTSCDPRMKVPEPRVSNAHWPTSPSSSSELTFEGVAAAPPAGSACSSHNVIGATSSSFKPSPDIDLDLSLSLRPYKGGTADQLLNKWHRRPSLVSHEGSRKTCNNLVMASSSSTLHHLQRSIVGQPSAIFPASIPGSGSIISGGVSMASGLSSLPQRKAVSSSMNDTPLPCMTRSSKLAMEEHDLNPNISARMQPSNHMITVGCANCLMLVMLPHGCNLKCPLCGASISCTDSELPERPPAPPSKKAKLAGVPPLVS